MAKSKKTAFALFVSIVCSFSVLTMSAENRFKSANADYHYTILEAGSFLETVTE